jgi:glyoxylate reductase
VADRPGVLVTRRLPASVLDWLRAHCDIDLHDADTDLPRSELLRRVAGKQGLLAMLVDVVDAELLAHADRLRVVANVAVGYNNIDVAAARARGIVVTNTPDVLTDATADIAWALILDITRRVSEGDRLVRAGGWKGWGLEFMLGTSLAGKQLGIVGMGRIGRAVAVRGRVFGMRVAYWQRDPSRPGEPDATPLSLERLLETSDVVSLHVPLNDQTRHMIDAAALARMKPTAYLVNTARGPVVDEAALAVALKERRIAGAALDVFEREPEVHPGLVELENVVLVPHLGSATEETREAMGMLCVEALRAVLLEGRVPPNAVG